MGPIEPRSLLLPLLFTPNGLRRHDIRPSRQLSYLDILPTDGCLSSFVHQCENAEDRYIYLLLEHSGGWWCQLSRCLQETWVRILLPIGWLLTSAAYKALSAQAKIK